MVKSDAAVVTLLGSPRKQSLSSALAELVASALQVPDSASLQLSLNDLRVSGCQACRACKTTSRCCVLKDDLTPALAAVPKSPVVILASPVYWGDISAQLKLAIDRFYSFLTPDFLSAEVKHRLQPGKQLVFILTQAAGEEYHRDIFPRYNAFFSELELFRRTFLLRGCGLDHRDTLASRPDLETAARELAGQLRSDGATLPDGSPVTNSHDDRNKSS